MENPTDQELVRAVQAGQVQAFARLVKRYQRKLVGFAGHLLRDTVAAEDVVLESLFRFYTTIDRVDTGRNIGVYLFSIVRNGAISALRARKNSVSLETLALAGEDETVYEQLFAAEKRELVSQAVSQLDYKYHRVIDLYYFADLSYEEIARRLKLPVNTVRTHLSRGKQQLKRLLSDYEKT